jgi:hypothetical protein
MRRRYLLSLIAAGLVVFLLISGLLARVFGANGAEQSAITDLIKAEAAGDQATMLKRIVGCAQSVACRGRVAQDATTLKGSGAVSIIELNPSTSFSLGSTTGTARVAWSVGSSLPVVQCVRVRRSGDVLSGLHVSLLELSARIKTDADCPARY